MAFHTDPRDPDLIGDLAAGEQNDIAGVRAALEALEERCRTLSRHHQSDFLYDTAAALEDVIAALPRSAEHVAQLLAAE